MSNTIPSSRPPPSAYPAPATPPAPSAPPAGDKAGTKGKGGAGGTGGATFDDKFTQANTSPSQVDGNQGAHYNEWQKDVAEFKTDTGYNKDGTGAGIEASALEAEGDANYTLSPTELSGNLGAEANLYSVRGDVGYGKDLSDLGLGKIDGKAYLGAHGEVSEGVNADVKGSIGKDGVDVGAGALAGAEATGSVKEELGPVSNTLTGSAIVGVGASAHVTAKVENGKLTIGGSAKAALGLGAGVGMSTTIDLNKLKKTVDNFTDGKASKAFDSVKEGVKGVPEKAKALGQDVQGAANKAVDTVKDGAKDLGNDVKKGFSKIFG